MAIPAAVPLAIMGATALWKLGSGIHQKSKAKKELAKLDAEGLPTFLSGEQINERANAAVTGGFSPQERSNFFNALNRGANQAYRKSVGHSPNLSTAIQSGLNYQQGGAIAEFGAKDADLRESKVQNMRSVIGNQDNQNTSAAWNWRMAREQAWGGAMRDGRQNMANAFDTLGRGAASLAIIGNGGESAAAAGGEDNRGGEGGGLYDPRTLNQTPLGNTPPSNSAPPYNGDPNIDDDYFANLYGGPFNRQGASNPNPKAQGENPPSAYADPYANMPIDNSWITNLYR